MSEKFIKDWDEIALGGNILEAGNAQCYETGSWRTFRPMLLKDRCINCLFCWIYCPDSAVIVKDGEVEGFDYDHCKGCAICREVCPVKGKAIEMVRDEKVLA